MNKIFIILLLFAFIPFKASAFCSMPIGSCSFNEDFASCQNRLNAEYNAYNQCQQIESIRKEQRHYQYYGCPYPSTICIK